MQKNERRQTTAGRASHQSAPWVLRDATRPWAIVAGASAATVSRHACAMQSLRRMNHAKKGPGVFGPPGDVQTCGRPSCRVSSLGLNWEVYSPIAQLVEPARRRRINRRAVEDETKP